MEAYLIAEQAVISAGETQEKSLTVTENGEYQVTPDSGKTLSKAEITVDVQPKLESLSVTENGSYTPTEGKDGFDRVEVDVPPTEPVIRPLAVTQNGSYSPEEGVDGFAPVTVNTPTPKEEQSKSLSVTENGIYTVDPDSGKVLSSVSVSVNVEPEFPPLTNPASAEDILAGKEALDGEGQKITGTLDTLADVEVTDWEEIGGYLAVIAENTTTGDTKEIITPIEAYEETVDVSLTTQMVAEEKYSIGVTVNGLTGARLTQLAPDAVPENIAAGKDIVGIIGTAELEDPTAKPLIANAITAKGVPTQETDSWDTMALHIGQISGGSEELAGLIDGTATEITVPDGVTAIGAYKFYNMTGLQTVELPSELESIGQQAFYGCTNLALTSLPSSLTTIGISAFSYCSSLALTSLPSGVTSVVQYTFAYCSSLALTSLPSGVTSIGAFAFQNCKNLALTSLPSGVTSIGTHAFTGCLGITEMTFTGKPTIISVDSFNNCTNLLDIYVPWEEGAVSGAPWGATNATIHYNHTP